MKRRRLSLSFLVLMATGCSSKGCSSLGPTPGGFPSAQRMPNAVQVRLSQTGIAALEADPVSFTKELFGGSLNLPVASSCGGSPAICCAGGTPSASCGPVVLDPTTHLGDSQRLTLAPVQGASRVDVTLRVRVKSVTDVPVTVPVVGDCGVHIDTSKGSVPDIALNVPITLGQDPAAGTTRLLVGTVSVSGLAAEDVSLTGSIGCTVANQGLSFFIGTLTNVLADALTNSLQQSTCKTCPSGQTAECGSFATACTAGTCMEGNSCLQELGAEGRLLSSTLFDGAPPGTESALDVYAVAGGYATSNTGGLAFGALGGAVPAGTARDRCGPAATPPAPVAIPQSLYFQGNTRPDTAAPFDVAFGFHQAELTQFAYAAYDSGALCATFDADAVTNLRSDALLTIAPSLGKIAPAGTPLFVGLRPQAPPVLTLGDNTFDAGGVVTAPLVSAGFTGMELDVYVAVEDQPIRVMTVAGDFVVPLGAKPGAPGEVALVLGTLADPTNVSVKNVDHLTESAATLATLAPVLQGLTIPEMVERLGPLVLPRIVGKPVTVQAVTAVDSQRFVGLFGSIPAPASPSVLPPPMTDGPVTNGAAGAQPNRSTPLSGTAGRLALFGALALVWAGMARRRPKRALLSTALVLLAGTLPVSCGSSGSNGSPGPGDASTRDGGGGNPNGAGGSPANQNGGRGSLGGNAGSGGLGGNAGSGAIGGNAGSGAIGGNAGSGAIGGSAGDSGTAGGGSTGADAGPCGRVTCAPGDVVRGGLGQWSSADSGTRTVVTTYDAVLGDLVLVDLSAATPTYTAVDGVPDVAPTHDPAGYRRGIDAPGPDVGAWTSVRLGANLVRVAYQDRDRSALRFSLEDAAHTFTSEDVDLPDATHASVGEYASLALGTVPAIAYRATSAVTAGSTVSELRFARAKKATPGGPGDWTITVVASKTAPVTAGRSGTALYVNLLPLSDGRFVIVYYDQTRTALVALVEGAANSGTFTETVLDGGTSVDRGAWASSVVDASGKVHVAYQDGLGHEVFYLSFTPGGAVSAPELVDDGTRAADRTHWVGAGPALWHDGTSPHVAYQDASGADVVAATRTTTWAHADLAVGATLDGFHIAAPPHGTGLLAWGQLDPSIPGSHQLVVHAP